MMKNIRKDAINAIYGNNFLDSLTKNVVHEKLRKYAGIFGKYKGKWRWKWKTEMTEELLEAQIPNPNIVIPVHDSCAHLKNRW